MTTNYDPIAEDYQRAKQQPWRSAIESFSLMGLLGDLAGKQVVDLACGEGFYTRRIRQQGATRSLGVDLSPRMVELARNQEAAQPIGAEYVVGDARALELADTFDLVVAAYLLNYARDREELLSMCRTCAKCLKPGGRFVTVNMNPALDFRAAPSYRKYGFTTSVAGERREGTPVTWTFFLASGPFSIENYFLDIAAHEDAFRTAGFSVVRWHQPKLSLQDQAVAERDFYNVFLEHSPIIFIECVKTLLQH